MKRSTSSIAAALAAAASDPFPFLNFSSNKNDAPDSATLSPQMSDPIDTDTPPIASTQAASPPHMTDHYDERPRDTASSGLIEVTKGRSNRPQVDPEIEALRRIPQVKPLIESSLSPAGFSWGGMFTQQQQTPRHEDLPYALDPAPAIALWDKCRAHVEQCAADVARDQHLLEARMTGMEEYCTRLANTVTNRCHDAKTQGEKLAALTSIKKQAEKTGSTLDDLIISLEKLEPLLPHAQQLGHPENQKRYPALTKLLMRRHDAEERAAMAARSR
ncbi:hypothetical protein HDU86_005606 [Geranomyces michiganensis]|nr:hypothetical protein HDU86_005606 [Geranomyces michiganensis]